MKKDKKIDTTYKVETPEGISLSYYPAGLTIRAVAFMVDLLCQTGIFFVISIALFLIWLLISSLLSFSLPSSMNSAYLFSGLYFLLSFLIFWWYFIFFEVLLKGQSIGKKICKIKVIHDDGTPVGWHASILRNLLRVVDLLPSFCYSVGIISSISNNSFKRLGDISAGTIVVYTNPEIIFTNSHLPDIEAKFSHYPLTQEEQKLIVNFAFRSHTLSAERRAELCKILDSIKLTDNTLTSEESLYAIAHSLLGSHQKGFKKTQ